MLDSLSDCIKPPVRNLGFMLDSALLFDKPVNAVVKSYFFHLRLLAKVKGFLNCAELKRLTHAFISSSLHYCNSVYLGIGCNSIYFRIFLMYVFKVLTGLAPTYLSNLITVKISGRRFVEPENAHQSQIIIKEKKEI